MQRELNIFFAALSFLTRLPVYKFTNYSEESLNKSSKYFPLIGVFIGFVAVIIYYCSALIFPISISILLSMISTIMLTGALHEDGFTDVCDAFGATNNKDKILEIMKDSRIGAYGVIGILFISLLKYFCLFEIPTKIFADVIIAGITISRFCAVSAMSSYKYARSNSAESKSFCIAKKLNNSEYLFATLILLIPFIFMNPVCIMAIPSVILLKELVMTYFNNKIGGYTGDCMGFLIILSEVVFYMSVLVLWKFI